MFKVLSESGSSALGAAIKVTGGVMLVYRY